jgi:hypothetical protein
LDKPLNPFHTKEFSPSELDDLLRRTGFTVERMSGLHHGPRIDDTIIERQVRLVVSGSPWPAELLAEVAAVTTEDFTITTENLDASLDLVAVARR